VWSVSETLPPFLFPRRAGGSEGGGDEAEISLSDQFLFSVGRGSRPRFLGGHVWLHPGLFQGKEHPGGREQNRFGVCVWNMPHFWLDVLSLLEGGPLPGPEHGLSSNTCVRGDTHMLRKQKALLGRGTQGESSRLREPRRTFCHLARSLRCHGNGVSFRVLSGQSSCLARTWSDSGSWWCVHLSAKMDSSTKDSGRLVPPPTGPSQILLVSLQGCMVFLIRAFCCETIHARGYYHVWPRWAVSVNGPLTLVPLSVDALEPLVLSIC